MTDENVVKIMTDSNYQDIIGNSKKLIIDVWAQWCGPCKRTSPVFVDMAEKSQDPEVVFAKLNSDENRDVASQLKIMSLPTFVIFENGNMTRKWSGGNVDRLRKEITKLVE